MYSIDWNKKDNIPVLTNKLNTEDSLWNPRPVFYEELDILGFDKYWEYPKSDSPLLWAIGRSYYYKGVEVAHIKGGGYYSDPEIQVFHKGIIKPVSIEKLHNDNKDKLITLENEAKQFINKEYLKYKDTATLALAYSGGKDSEVIFNLLTQVIPPDEFFVIYTNTGMELPDTLEFIESRIKSEQRLYPSLKFTVANQIHDIGYSWKQFGPPSRFHRWCCSVTKTVPFYIELAKHTTEHNQTLLFEGVRRSESHNRANHDREALSVKHNLVINSRPIINWNDTEVYLYLLSKNIELNPAYRKGLTRVGCSLCPFSSNWSELMIRQIYPNLNDRLMDEIRTMFKYNGLEDKQKQLDYIDSGKWKMRAGGRTLPDLESEINHSFVDGERVAYVTNPQSSLIAWLNVFDYHLSYTSDNEFTVTIYAKNETASYRVYVSEDGIKAIYNKNNSILVDGLFTKVLIKTTYCVGCHMCAIECPNGAISFDDGVRIDESKCVHCLQCITQIKNGCLIASSRTISLGGNTNMQQNKKIDRYSTFGLRESWIINYLNDPEEWDSGLGSKQKPALRFWLQEANLMCENNQPTELCLLIKNLDLTDVMGIAWTNLAYNSGIVEWYHCVEYKYWERNELFNALREDIKGYSESTLKNPFGALLNTFSESDILSNIYGQGILSKKGRAVTGIEKRYGYRPSNIVLLYALFRHAEEYGAYNTTLSELYSDRSKQTPYQLFGIMKDELQKVLLGLQEHRAKFLRVEFNANLDNIFINKDYSANDVIKTFLEM